MKQPSSGRRRGTGTSESAGRLFLGVPLSGEIRRELGAHLEGALRGRGLPGRPVPPANWHLTLRFLGAAERAQAARLTELLHDATLGTPFPLAFGGLGAFPRARRASVLWVGVTEGRAELGALAGVVERAAEEAGFAREQRPFAAHLTLSRLNPPQDVTATLEAVPPFGGRMAVGEVVLFRSHLGGGPARYEAVERFPLG